MGYLKGFLTGLIRQNRKVKNFVVHAGQRITAMDPKLNMADGIISFLVSICHLACSKQIDVEIFPMLKQAAMTSSHT
ncbi:hypothetical protein ACX1JO_003822 [Cronobacter dublinensis]